MVDCNTVLLCVKGAWELCVLSSTMSIPSLFFLSSIFTGLFSILLWEWGRAKKKRAITTKSTLAKYLSSNHHHYYFLVNWQRNSIYFSSSSASPATNNLLKQSVQRLWSVFSFFIYNLLIICTCLYTLLVNLSIFSIIRLWRRERAREII